MPMSLRVAPTHQPTLKQKQTLVYQHLLLLRSKTDCYRYVQNENVFSGRKSVLGGWRMCIVERPLWY